MTIGVGLVVHLLANAHGRVVIGAGRDFARVIFTNKVEQDNARFATDSREPYIKFVDQGFLININAQDIALVTEEVIVEALRLSRYELTEVYKLGLLDLIPVVTGELAQSIHVDVEIAGMVQDGILEVRLSVRTDSGTRSTKYGFEVPYWNKINEKYSITSTVWDEKKQQLLSILVRSINDVLQSEAQS